MPDSSSQPEPEQPPATLRPASIRLNDYYEVYRPGDADEAVREGRRCMNCGAAFCQPSGGYVANNGRPAGCPIDNKIPEWNELVTQDRWREAYERLALTNNLPEVTSRLCPAPCQDACIVGLNDRPVGIKRIERAISDRAFDEGWVQPVTPARRTGRRVAIIGSGPAGLTAADQLNRLGHRVAVFERSDRPGGLLMYGVPNMKLDKSLVERRIDLLTKAGITFRTGVEIGVDVGAATLLAEHDAVVLACGALRARELDIPGRTLRGVHRAMDYLTGSTRALMASKGGGAEAPRIHAQGKDVIIIGGGDTGADCIATALRQGCRSVRNITRRPQPPGRRDAAHPWPGPTGALQMDYAHAEGSVRFGEDPRDFEAQPLAFLEGDAAGTVGAVRVRWLDTGEAETLPADLVILAIGFTGADAEPLFAQLGVRSVVPRAQPHDPMEAAAPGVFMAGDCRIGPSLAVHAIAEGRAAAEQVDRYLKSRDGPRRSQPRDLQPHAPPLNMMA